MEKQKGYVVPMVVSLDGTNYLLVAQVDAESIEDALATGKRMVENEFDSGAKILIAGAETINIIVDKDGNAIGNIDRRNHEAATTNVDKPFNYWG